mgnify:CR=1 FL=1
MFNPNIWLRNFFSASVSQATFTFIARLLVAYLFIVAGWGKVIGFAGTAGYMASKGIPEWMLVLVILLELGGGIAILVGFQTRVVALFLVFFNILTAFMFHGDPSDATAFMKNIAISGGYLYLAVHGAGRFSLDYLLEGRKL